MTQAFYVYVLSCADGSLYTGWTTDVEKRVQTHNAGKGAKATRSRLPVSLVHQWAFSSKSEAMRFEVAFKKLSRAEKLRRLASVTQ